MHPVQIRRRKEKNRTRFIWLNVVQLLACKPFDYKKNVSMPALECVVTICNSHITHDDDIRYLIAKRSCFGSKLCINLMLMLMLIK